MSPSYSYSCNFPSALLCGTDSSLHFHSSVDKSRVMVYVGTRDHELPLPPQTKEATYKKEEISIPKPGQERGALHKKSCSRRKQVRQWTRKDPLRLRCGLRSRQAGKMTGMAVPGLTLGEVVVLARPSIWREAWVRIRKREGGQEHWGISGWLWEQQCLVVLAEEFLAGKTKRK